MDAMSSSRSSPTPPDRRRAVARILGPKGLHGAVRIEVLTDWPSSLEAGSEVWVDSETEPRRIATIEAGGRVPALQLEGVATREAAALLAGSYIEGPPRQRDAGSWFWDELVGLRVQSTDGRELGEVVEIFRAGGNEVYRVVGPGGERLVPALRSAVARIDPDAGVMILTDDEPEDLG